MLNDELTASEYERLVEKVATYKDGCGRYLVVDRYPGGPESAAQYKAIGVDELLVRAARERVEMVKEMDGLRARVAELTEAGQAMDREYREAEIARMRAETAWLTADAALKEAMAAAYRGMPPQDTENHAVASP